MKRKRQRYEAGGVAAVVDHRLAPHASLLGRADPRVAAAMRQAIAESVPASTRTIEYARWRTGRILAAEHGEGLVEMPSRATFYRLFGKLSGGVHVTGSARTRRSLADQPEGPFRYEQVAAPGELMQIDEGVPGRVELCGLVDVATRTIVAAVVRPTTKSVDASLLLARALTPEPMRPGWSDALKMSRSVLPHRRLLSLDERLEHAAARPVIIPETIVCDRGKAFISENFRAACRTLEIIFQPCHPRSPAEKPHIERTEVALHRLAGHAQPRREGLGGALLPRAKEFHLGSRRFRRGPGEQGPLRTGEALHDLGARPGRLLGLPFLSHTNTPSDRACGQRATTAGRSRPVSTPAGDALWWAPVPGRYVPLALMIEGEGQGMSERGALRGLRVLMWVVIAIEVPVYLVWLVQVGYLTGQELSRGDVARWAPPVLLPPAAVLFCVMAGWTWWLSVVAGTRSSLRERWIVASLVFVAAFSVFCGVASVDNPSVSVGLLSAAVTGLGMIGLFFIPAAASSQLPDVIRRRSRRTATAPGEANPNPQ
ncbi:hypothetical protein [Streptomyces netropsis]|uniref:hypothetical protein n=1 Tax=Streptomyces netropsis TaxID=55404 RepID=UPI003BB4EFD1